MKIRAIFPWQSFNWYLQTIELDEFSEDENSYYGKPINLRCCSGHKNKTFGILPYPKYAWEKIESQST